MCSRAREFIQIDQESTPRWDQLPATVFMQETDRVFLPVHRPPSQSACLGEERGKRSQVCVRAIKHIQIDKSLDASGCWWCLFKEGGRGDKYSLAARPSRFKQALNDRLNTHDRRCNIETRIGWFKII